MTFTLLRRLVTQVFVVLVALAAILTSGAPAQSLGDVAKQEGARRKATSSGKTYTNDDLKGAPAPTATPAAPAAPAADAAPGTPPADDKSAKPDAKTGTGTEPADAKGDEASWRTRRENLQQALDRAQTFANALQSQINALTTDFASRDDPAQRARVGTERQKALTELERVKKEIQQHTKALADLQEEARKAGVPPGWLR